MINIYYYIVGAYVLTYPPYDKRATGDLEGYAEVRLQDLTYAVNIATAIISEQACIS